MKYELSEYNKKIEERESFIYAKIGMFLIILLLVFFAGCATFLSIQFLFNMN